MLNPSISEVLTMLHAKLKPKQYLEIGGDGCSFVGYADKNTEVVGVSHWPKWDLKKLPPNILIYPVTSDYFLHSSYMLRTINPDLILIDGFKKFEQIMKIFCMVEVYFGRPGVTVLIHDTSPTDPSAAIRPKFGSNEQPLCGDGYKFLSILKKRTDLKIQQLTCNTGLTIVTNLDKDNSLFRDRMAFLVRDYLDLPLDKRETCFDISYDDYVAGNDTKQIVKEEVKEEQEIGIHIS